MVVVYVCTFIVVTSNFARCQKNPLDLPLHEIQTLMSLSNVDLIGDYLSFLPTFRLKAKTSPSSILDNVNFCW